MLTGLLMILLLLPPLLLPPRPTHSDPLEEFQDKLFFGVDYCTIKNYRELSHFLDEGVENGRISQKAYNKICRENLLALVEG